ncbi:MAG: patatin family protein [Clostridia bacterium]|nr:patatin family protein [Clostridia bacterium]
MKTGLVLEGGAMRGLFTAGILDVMMEEGIYVDGLIGVSAGAAFGCSYKSGQKGRTLRYNLKYAKDKRYCSLYSLITTGDLYGADFCYHRLPEELDIFDNQAFTENPMEFYLVCTDVRTGKPVYHQCETADYTTMEWFRASASLPLVSRVVSVDGYELMDGGIADSIPLTYFESIGYEKNIVILTQPKEYRKTANKAMPLAKWKMRKYPNMIARMERRHLDYNSTLDAIAGRENDPNLLVLQPECPLPIKRIEKNPETLQRVYDMGRDLALRRLEEIRAFVG